MDPSFFAVERADRPPTTSPNVPASTRLTLTVSTSPQGSWLSSRKRNTSQEREITSAVIGGYPSPVATGAKMAAPSTTSRLCAVLHERPPNARRIAMQLARGRAISAMFSRPVTLSSSSSLEKAH
jgi:hypothetical protein